ncbi:hypothetical protein FVE85_6695 [Porphyridium purpureum]|uniref:DUF1664 domain-containing protein n=1 Tax=Porphyridium purpureum TaxID=35688 RepID=A0A5J4Z7L3_PORPP|nr:hypothetical protein FVE85_6695 [Porphyridium purpureum]|eukprot:POR7373..scf295_1
MAAAAGASRSLGTVFAAGFGGAYAYNNLGEIGRGLARVLDTAAPSSRPSHHGWMSHDTTAVSPSAVLMQHVESLSRQVAELSRAGYKTGPQDHVVYVGGATPAGYAAQTMSTIVSIALLAGASGSAVYILLRTWGYKVDDLAWVSRSLFQSTTQSLRNMVSKLSVSLGTVRDELLQRIGMVEMKVDASHNELMDKIGTDVGAAVARVDGVAKDVGEVHRSVRMLDARINDVQSGIRYTKHGIYLLCQIVAQMPESQASHAWDELKRFTSFQPNQELPAQSQPPAQSRVQQQQQQFGFESLPSTVPSVSSASMSSTHARTHSGLSTVLDGAWLSAQAGSYTPRSTRS